MAPREVWAKTVAANNRTILSKAGERKDGTISHLLRKHHKMRSRSGRQENLACTGTPVAKPLSRRIASGLCGLGEDSDGNDCLAVAELTRFQSHTHGQVQSVQNQPAIPGV